jgi:hypothetical protein
VSAEAYPAFAAAAELFVGVVRRVPPGAWDQPALGEWSVRDLTGHTARALANVERYLAAAPAHADITGPDAYYRLVARHGSDAEVAERGRQAGRELGEDPAGAVAALAARVVPLALRTPETALVATPVGGMRLGDYLPTRVLELTVHSLDLAAALALEVDLPRQAAAVSLRLVADLALTAGAGALLLAATGRGPLPPGYTVL